jgi:RNA-directed DNA polymerase
VGKRKSFARAVFGRAIEKLGIAKPRMTGSRCLQHDMVFA